MALKGSVGVQDAGALGHVLSSGPLGRDEVPGFTDVTPGADPAPTKTKGGRTKTKKAKSTGGGGDGGGDPAEVVPTTPLDKAKGARKAILKECEDARSLALSIDGLECSGELQEGLTVHADSLTKLYKQINDMILQGVNEGSQYKPIFDTHDQLSNWFKHRKRIAKSMKSAAENAALGDDD